MDITSPDLDHIVAQDLLDTERLKDLYRQAVHRGYWPNRSASALEFAAYAEKALQDDQEGTPGALFYALVKRKDGSMVTDAQEQRAQERWPSHVREDLVASARAPSSVPAESTPTGLEEALFESDVGYVHASMMQCFLPQQAITNRHYQTSHGRASLIVEAGHLINPNHFDQWIQCEVPSGTKPRLILPYITGEAIRNRSPVVNLGESLRRFMTFLGVPVTGHNGKKLTEQIQNLAAATILLGQWNDDGAHMVGARVATRVSFWIERDPGQATLWTPEMTLSEEFYLAVQEHRVPVDTQHLAKLARSPRRMDLYSWLSYRTPKIRPRGRVPVNLHALWSIFGPDLARLPDFRARLHRDLRAIATIYPGFNVEIDGDILWLRRSRPPVPYRAQPTLPLS